MSSRILIPERNPTDPAVWPYDLADAKGRLPEQHYRVMPCAASTFASGSPGAIHG